MKKLIKTLFIIMLLLFPFSVYAWMTYTIRLQTWDLVDSGKHLDWSGSTKYSSQYNSAISKWEGHISGVIRKDTLTTVNDLTISDKNEGANGYPATTMKAGKMVFNTYYMDKYPNSVNLNICIHELGHALRLDHRTDSNSVMQEAATQITTLSEGDKANYTKAYNEYY